MLTETKFIDWVKENLNLLAMLSLWTEHMGLVIENQDPPCFIYGVRVRHWTYQIRGQGKEFDPKIAAQDDEYFANARLHEIRSLLLYFEQCLRDMSYWFELPPSTTYLGEAMRERFTLLMHKRDGSITRMLEEISKQSETNFPLREHVCRKLEEYLDGGIDDRLRVLYELKNRYKLDEFEPEFWHLFEMDITRIMGMFTKMKLVLQKMQDQLEYDLVN